MSLRRLEHWLAIAVLLAGTRLGAADYSFVILPPTPDMPSGTPVVGAALNNLGQVAGYETGPLKQLVPVVWTGGVPAKLDMLPGYRLTGIRSINAAGQVLGQANLASSKASVGILWTNGKPEILTGPAACAGPSTTVINMNAAGHVLGETVGGSCHVFWVSRGGAIRTFPTPDPKYFTLVGMNDADHILGYYFNQSKPYTPYEIYVIELGQPFIHYPFPAASGPFLSLPNNLDEFTGQAFQEGPSYNYLWTGPSTLVGLPPNNAESIFFSNVNDGGALLSWGGGPYSIQRGATVVDQVGTNAAIDGNPVLNDGMQFLAGLSLGSAPTALFTPEFACLPTNVTGQVSVSAGDIGFDPSTGRFTQEVTLTNRDSSAIEGAAFLVLDHLAPQVSVYGLTATTVRTPPSGNPYVRVPPSFGPPGVPVTFELQFLDVDYQPIQWTPRVFAACDGL